MACFRPLKGYRSRLVNESGRRSIVFSARDGFYDMPVDLPCGQCIGCRLERSRQWAMRCVHEASLYDSNCFITLTYRDECLPSGGSLVLKDFQDFMKRLRKRFGSGIRFFHCGEYGSKFSRPHYHACLFNFDFSDRVLWKMGPGGTRLYISDSLSELWPFGFSTVGDVTFESAAYVARYIMKKVTGERAPAFYGDRCPEYVTMSRRPGLGKGWLERFRTDVYPSDFVVMRERKMKPPKYYDSQFEIAFPSDFAEVKRKRILNAREYSAEFGDTRLATKERVQEARLKQLKRSYENDV